MSNHGGYLVPSEIVKQILHFVSSGRPFKKERGFVYDDDTKEVFKAEYGSVTSVTIKDLECGSIRECATYKDEYYFIDGNGCCDCNRAIMFFGGIDSPEVQELDRLHGGGCYGESRFLIIDAEVEFVENKQQFIDSVNHWYEAGR